MRKAWKKRLLTAALVLVGTGLALVLGAFLMVRGRPSWYVKPTFNPAEQAQASQNLENKLIETRNWAAAASAQERAEIRANQTATSPSTRPAGPVAQPITVSFTQDELNASLYKWLEFNKLKDKVERFVHDPVILLQDGRVILAGEVKTSNMDSILSAHFAPKLNADGKLDVGFGRLFAGRLPMPDAAIADYRDKLLVALAEKMPAWQQEAKLDEAGVTNDSFIHATLGKLLQATLLHEPTDALIFLPLDDRRGIAARLTAIEVGEKKITVTVERIPPADRKRALESLSDPFVSASQTSAGQVVPVSR